jgi:hypothetical protein
MRIHSVRKMSLSIDEAGRRCTLCGRNHGKKQSDDGTDGKRFPWKLKYLWKFYKFEDVPLAGKKLPMRNKANNQQDSRRKTDARRNIRWGGLVYTSAAGRAAQASQRNYKKNPAVAAAGR